MLSLMRWMGRVCKGATDVTRNNVWMMHTPWQWTPMYRARCRM